MLDFIGNDYKRSVQIAFALGSLSENFVAEKDLVAELVKNDYKSLGLEKYGVEIHIDELSKKEIETFIKQENFIKVKNQVKMQMELLSLISGKLMARPGKYIYHKIK